MYLRNGRFSMELKKANAVPIHKKGNKQTIKNYCSVLLLPICGENILRLALWHYGVHGGLSLPLPQKIFSPICPSPNLFKPQGFPPNPVFVDPTR